MCGADHTGVLLSCNSISERILKRPRDDHSDGAVKETDSETSSGGDSDYEAPICKNKSWTRDEAIRVARKHAACTGPVCSENGTTRHSRLPYGTHSHSRRLLRVTHKKKKSAPLGSVGRHPKEQQAALLRPLARRNPTDWRRYKRTFTAYLSP